MNIIRRAKMLDIHKLDTNWHKFSYMYKMLQIKNK